jgi:hypothetical protein
MGANEGLAIKLDKADQRIKRLEDETERLYVFARKFTPCPEYDFPLAAQLLKQGGEK